MSDTLYLFRYRNSRLLAVMDADDLAMLPHNPEHGGDERPDDWSLLRKITHADLAEAIKDPGAALSGIAARRYAIINAGDCRAHAIFAGI